ncbi:MAG: TSUP family transporter [Bacteroidota bacterium]
MNYLTIFDDYGILVVILLAIAAFTAGFIDAIVGGGGLIQTPFLLIQFPNMPLPVLFGTNKIAALAGTSISAIRYAKHITFDFKLLFVVAASCFVSSFMGARLVTSINSDILKPIILIILIGIAVYTFLKKDLGAVQKKDLPMNRQMLYGSAIGLVVGFYDGFFGPGTGSFFVLGFVIILGFEFVKASAYAKVVNCITNISALIIFVKNGYYILPLAILMGMFNMAGSYMGSHMALKKGNGFVRIIFLVIVTLMILKYGYDVVSGYLDSI